MSPIMPDTQEARELMAPIPDGTYRARIESAEAKTAKSSGNPILELKLKINVNGQERSRTTTVSVTGKGAFGFDQLLRACHMDELADVYGGSGNKPPFDEKTLEGQELLVQTSQELYEGQVRDRVRNYLKA